MSDPLFSILLPVHRGPELLPFAIDSVLAQTRSEFELFVICDGAPPETAACARLYGSTDPRIRLFEHAKGERHGETHRHAALQAACGTYVCQIADDDLWFPNHLAEMARLLEGCDFGNLTHTNVDADGRPTPSFFDLSHGPTRERMLVRKFNFFGPTAAGYRLSAYRRLEQGWGPAPPGIWSDLFMWRKFLGVPDLRSATRHSITSLSFATPQRLGWTIAERQAENERFAALLSTASGRAGLRAKALREGAAQLGDQYFRLHESRSERMTRLALRLLGRGSR